MARGRRKVTTTSLDDKIELQKAVLEKAKIKYEKENSEIRAFINGMPDDED